VAGAAAQAVGAVSDKIILGTLANVRGFVESGVANALPLPGQQRAAGIANARNGVRAGVGLAVAVGAYVGAGEDVGVVSIAVIYHCPFFLIKKNEKIKAA